MSETRTREPQYENVLDLAEEKGLSRLGLVTNQVWHDDPRRLCYVLARYKFAAKMLAGKQRVLEVGCGDAFGTRVVCQEVDELCAIDFDPVFVQDANERMEDRWKFDCLVHDIVAKPLERSFDAAYTLDVIEHIRPENEDLFVGNIAASLVDHGVLIVGTPSVQSQAYASEVSKEGHVNCMDHHQLKNLMLKYFHNVFIFSMNDEVVHTGFYPMAHYLIALAVGKRSL